MIRPRASLLMWFSCAMLMVSSVALPQDRVESLEKAKEKFEKEISKLDQKLIEQIDKELSKKSGAREIRDKLTYERPRFTSYHILPTAIPVATEVYLRERTKATNALLKEFNPVINELTKAKKFTELEAVEDDLSAVLKANRGYGLAVPVDLEKNPATYFLIVNKQYDYVIDTLLERGRWRLVLNPKPKPGTIKASQCWTLEREEKGFSIWNVANGECFDLERGNSDPGSILLTYAQDRRKEILPFFVFRLSEVRREFFIEPAVNQFALTPFERKEKGVTTIFVTQNKKETPASASQLWTLVPVK